MTFNLTAEMRAAFADRYRIERELGAGGMATVFLAHDLKHDRAVAIKVMHPEIAQSLGTERFLREIAMTANLRHPHILPLYDSGAAAGIAYYVMPFIEGGSLRDRLDRDKQLPSTRPSPSPVKSPTHSATRMPPASYTATSSPRTSCSSVVTPS